MTPLFVQPAVRWPAVITLGSDSNLLMIQLHALSLAGPQSRVRRRCCFRPAAKKSLSHSHCTLTALSLLASGLASCPAGRPIVYACSWPAYQVGEGQQPDYKAIAQTCNLWRNFDDIQDSWQSVLSIIDFYAQNQDVFSAINGNWQCSSTRMHAVVVLACSRSARVESSRLNAF